MNPISYTLLVVVGLFVLRADAQLSLPSDEVHCPGCNITILIKLGPFCRPFSGISEEDLLRYTTRKVENPCTQPEKACFGQAATCTMLTEPYFYTCTCNEGYSTTRFNYNITCSDINECLSVNCSGHGSCINTAGSFECNCDIGYDVSPLDPAQCIDIYECSLGACNSDTEDCIPTPGSHICNCKPGYGRNSSVCKDIDECVIDPCDGNAECKNTNGSFTCTCKTNFTGDGNTCKEIHVCDTGEHTCKEREVCVEDGVGFACICITGYQKSGTNCTDTDECEIEADDCHADARCVNTMGSFTCACRAGYTGDGKVCKDDNTCSDSTQCGEFEYCKILDGSHECACVLGYIKIEQTCKLAEPLTSELVRHFRRWIFRYGPSRKIKWMINNYQKVAPFPKEWMDGLPHFKKLCL